MMKTWVHRCNIRWLETRKKYLTASDVYRLWPKTKTGRDRKVSDLEYLKIWCDKVQGVSESDCVSKDWAARGHILEPYAVAQFNEHMKPFSPELYYWDDCLLFDSEDVMAYSPDSLDVNQSSFIGPSGRFVSLPSKQMDLSCVGEVKSYSPARHLETAMTPNELVEERIQIAVAMFVSPGIERGYLILFNPDVPKASLVVKEYDRDSLASEIETVGEIRDRWKGFDVEKAIDNGFEGSRCFESTVSVDSIYDEYCKKAKEEWERMNEI